MSSGSDPTQVQTPGEGGHTPGPASQWLRAFQQLFDPHPSHVALVAVDGTVVAVNAAWVRYGRANGLAAGYEFVGQNYLAVCEAAVAAEYPSAREAYLGLLDVLRNGRPKFTLIYPCHTPARREWYRMWVEPQTPAVPAVIVAHQLVVAKPWGAEDPPAPVGVRSTSDPYGGFDARSTFPA